MTIFFDWYENPLDSQKPDEEKRLHARPVYNGKIGTKKLREAIERNCSLTEVDVSAVLDALSVVMGEELSQGRQVHLDGIGYFYPTLKCTEEVTAGTPRRNTKVGLKGIRFRADQKLKNSVGSVTLVHNKHARHSVKLTHEEIDKRVKDYFKDKQVMVRIDFQNICGMTRCVATNHLRRLLEEEKLKNIGSKMHPIYVPFSLS